MTRLKTANQVLLSALGEAKAVSSANAASHAGELHAIREELQQQVAAGECVGAAWVVDARKAPRKLDRTHALLMAQKRAVYGLFLGDDGRLSLAAPMETNVDLPQIFGTRGGMRNRITLPMARLAEVLAFVEAQG